MDSSQNNTKNNNGSGNGSIGGGGAATRSAVEQAMHDDLASPTSPSSNVDVNSNNNEDIDDEKAHSFRERRLTYTRHHILSDSAAAAVAQLLADGGDDFSDDESEEGGDKKEVATEEAKEGVTKEGEDKVAFEGVEAEAAAAASGGKRKTTLEDHAEKFYAEADDNEKLQHEEQRPRKRAKTDDSTSPTKPHLPSRILHAGEIARRYSDSSKKSKRTGLYSHPTHPNAHPHHAHGGHGHHHKNKWRQRFSFCSTTPDHILPFPRSIVGTYSCHGMEPVYDSDYENSSSSSSDSDSESDNSGSEDKCSPKKKKKKSSTAKINQDRGGITYPYANSTHQALFAVYDGHGEGGELVSQYALGEVQRILEGRLRSCLPPVVVKKSEKKNGGLGMIAEEEEGSDKEGNVGKGQENQLHKEEEDEEEEEYIAEAMRETFVKVDRGLLDEADIEPMYSGTTACVVLLRNNKLYISNCGDSRAVLASRTTSKSNHDNVNKIDNDDESTSAAHHLTTLPLSIDQNPDSPGEKERILSLGGYVSPPPEPGLSSRVWLDAGHTQIGLAMARSIGDHAVKGVGVIAEPVVSTHTLRTEDEFMIIATDGVWEFISSEDAVEIVAERLYKEDDKGSSSVSGASEACEALIKAASEKWHEYEGDYRDDITAIVIRLKDLWS